MRHLCKASTVDVNGKVGGSKQMKGLKLDLRQVWNKGNEQ
jgi:hypothetical protein